MERQKTVSAIGAGRLSHKHSLVADSGRTARHASVSQTPLLWGVSGTRHTDMSSANAIKTVRNLCIYLVGVAIAVAGALGLADAMAVQSSAAAVLFVLGLVLVIAVHESLDGPIPQ